MQNDMPQNKGMMLKHNLTIVIITIIIIRAITATTRILKQERPINWNIQRSQCQKDGERGNSKIRKGYLQENMYVY